MLAIISSPSLESFENNDAVSQTRSAWQIGFDSVWVGLTFQSLRQAPFDMDATSEVMVNRHHRYRQFGSADFVRERLSMSFSGHSDLAVKARLITEQLSRGPAPVESFRQDQSDCKNFIRVRFLLYVTQTPSTKPGSADAPKAVKLSANGRHSNATVQRPTSLPRVVDGLGYNPAIFDDERVGPVAHTRMLNL